MSWVIKASPKLALFDQFREPEPGDTVRVLPGDNKGFGPEYERIIGPSTGGPVGKVMNKWPNHPEWGNIIQVQFPNTGWWLRWDRVEVIS